MLSKRLHHEIYTCSVRFEGGQQASLRLSRIAYVDVASSKRSLTFFDVRAHTTCAAEGHRLRFEVAVGVSTSSSQTLRIRHVPFSSAVAGVRTRPSGPSHVSRPSWPHAPAAWRVHVPPCRKDDEKGALVDVRFTSKCTTARAMAHPFHRDIEIALRDLDGMSNRPVFFPRGTRTRGSWPTTDTQWPCIVHGRREFAIPPAYISAGGDERIQSRKLQENGNLKQKRCRWKKRDHMPSSLGPLAGGKGTVRMQHSCEGRICNRTTFVISAGMRVGGSLSNSQHRSLTAMERGLKTTNRGIQ